MSTDPTSEWETDHDGEGPSNIGESAQETYEILPFTPPTEEETARRSGLALSIGVAFVVSTVFGGFVGWIADLLLGSAPWALVGGILFGGALGFFQVFRISAQILGNEEKGPQTRPLMSSRENEND